MKSRDDCLFQEFDQLLILSLESYAQYKAPNNKPARPPLAQFRSPPVDLNSNPVAVAAQRVFSSSSVSRTNFIVTPIPLYMTATTPSELADRAPCFIT